MAAGELYEKETCGNCDGTGNVNAYQRTSSDQYFPVPCKRCKGCGVVWRSKTDIKNAYEMSNGLNDGTYKAV